MAFDFGELRYSTSRAYDELEDEDDGNSCSNIEYSLILDLSDDNEVKNKLAKCETVIVSYGTLATEFCDTLLSKQCTDCGSIKIEDKGSIVVDESADFRPRKPKSSSLFMIQDGILICNASQDVTAVIANKFAKMLLGLVSTTARVLVLSSHHYSLLQGRYSPTNDSNCIVHSLISPSFTHSPAYPQLPQPATLNSVPAAIMTECIVKDKPCILYPVFTETYSTGDLDLIVDSLIKVFRHEPFKHVLSSIDKSTLNQYRSKNSRKEMLDRYM